MKSLPFNLWRLWFLLLVIGYFLGGYLFFQLPDDKLHIWFFDVGQGDSVLIKTPENHQILIDGGPGNKVLLELAKVLPFYDRSLDVVILTHPHEDHISGIVEVLKRFKVDLVVFAGINSYSGTYGEFLREIENQEIDFLIADELSDFKLGEVLFDVVYPIEQLLLADSKNLNNSSVVVRMVSDKVSVLFTGDLEEEGEKDLLKRRTILKSDILKVGHHGSKTSSTMDFLIKVDPDIAVITVGKGNSFGHPHDEVLRNLKAADIKEIWRTDIGGTLHLSY